MKHLANLRSLFLLFLLSLLLAACDTTEEADPIDVNIAPARVVADSAYTVTGTGLKYFDFVVGPGPTAQVGNQVLVHYSGWLEDGTLFDSSHINGEPIEFYLGEGFVIAGWDEGILNMRAGGERQLVIPPHLAYGALGRGPIPPNATLIFEVEFLGITGTASP